MVLSSKQYFCCHRDLKVVVTQSVTFTQGAQTGLGFFPPFHTYCITYNRLHAVFPPLYILTGFIWQL